jgi:hypothetical protein
VTATNGRNIDEAGSARTADGTLHVLWQRRSAPLREGIMNTRVSPAGTAAAAAVVLDGLKAVSNADVAVTPDGRLRAFFMGLGTTAEEGGVVSASAPPSGVGWTREGVRVSSSSQAVGPVGAAVTAAGQPVFAYAMSFVLGLHVGLNRQVADVNLAPDRRCCDYLPDVATDRATGESYVAWYSRADGRRGVWAQRVVPPLGPQMRAPGSVVGDRSVGQDQRTAIAARSTGGGVYVAYCNGYPTCKGALLWRVGAPSALRAGSSADVEDVNVAAAPEGRLWVMWHDGQSSRRILARRTNKAVTRLGPVRTIRPPRGTSAIWKLGGEGSLGPLDLLASVSTPGSLATWHTQVRPPLMLSVSVAKTKSSRKTVSFSVNDVGDPVANAKLTVGGKTRAVPAGGKLSLKLSRGRYAATATAPGYDAAKARVIVR